MAINLEIGVESAGAERLLAAATGQLPFATSLAINNTAKDFQRVQIAGMFQRFTIRRPTYARRAVKIKPFATKHKLEARVSIDPPGGKPQVFGRHEEPGVEHPEGRHFTIPVEVRRTGAGIVSKRDRPRNFGFVKIGSGPKAEVWKGRRRTFMIRYHGGGGVIYQRTGPRGGGGSRSVGSQGRDRNLKVLFRLVEFARLEDRLQFVDTGQETVRKKFDANFAAAYERALRTAR